MSEITQDFQTWLSFAVGDSETEPGGEEGGWNGDDPSADNPTWRGIEYFEACDYFKVPRGSMTFKDFRAKVTRTVIGEIAWNNYWLLYHVPLLPQGPTILYMDQCWVGGGVYDLQAAMNTLFSAGLATDGDLGEKTLTAMMSYLPTVDAVPLIDAIEASSEKRYESLAKFATDGAGWLARLHSCAALA